MMMSKASMFHHAAAGIVLSVITFGALCGLRLAQVFALFSLLRALKLFLMLMTVVYFCLLHKCFQTDC